MDLGSIKREIKQLSMQSAYSKQDVDKITQMAMAVMRSNRLNDQMKQNFAKQVNALKEKGADNLSTGEVKMILNLFVQGMG